ncbi:MAG: branched-chain amino acid ABC transporter permease [Thermoleophilia bacterium]|nr:branched-chain amino acid ABC transporter permease [Thermoleophilia bacterium]
MTDLITTINLAAVYGLIGVGISLTWAGLGFLNLAGGVTFAASLYGAWWAQENISDHASVIFLGGIVLGAVSGAIVWLSVFLPLDGKKNWDMRSIIASLGLAIIGTNTFLLVFGPQRKAIEYLFGTSKFKIGGATVTADKSGAIISATVVMALVVVALMRSRMGLGVRALTQNPEGAALVGISRRQAAFAILTVSGMLAGFAAVLLSQIFYPEPNIGYLPLLKGLIVALLGGLGSIGGAVIAALLVGATEAVTAHYLDQSWILLTQFGLIALVLLVRPRGVAGILEASRA